MIFHEERNYLFVHIQKTGGTSISAHLTGHFDARFVSPAHLPLRCLAFEGPKPFIFAAIRNPWERLVSWYEMMRAKGVHNDFSRYLLQAGGDGQAPGFSEFIRRTAVISECTKPESLWSRCRGLIHDETQGYQKSLSFNQVDYLTDPSGRMICDRFVMFSGLAEGMSALTRVLHPDRVPLTVPHLNVRSSPTHWRAYYQSGDDREWVARLYWKDLNHFGFSFETDVK